MGGRKLTKIGVCYNLWDPALFSLVLTLSFSLRCAELRHVCLSFAGKLTDLTKRIDAALLKGILLRHRMETLSHNPLPPLPPVCVCDLR